MKLTSSRLASRFALLAFLPSTAVLAQSVPAGPTTAADPAATMPATTNPSAMPVSAATAVPNPADAKTPIEAARAYASLFKAGTPRAATSLYIDADALAFRCFGDDYKKSTPAEQLEIRELIKSVIYLDYLNPQLPMILSTLTYENFHEVVGVMADGVDVEYDLSGPQVKGKQKLTFQQVNGTWRIVDLWMGPNSLSRGVGAGWTQMKSQVNLVTFCRFIVIPRQMQQQPGPNPDDHGGPPQGAPGGPPPQGPAQGPARPPAGPAGPALP